jgi:hypothetical protein
MHQNFSVFPLYEIDLLQQQALGAVHVDVHAVDSSNKRRP